MFAHLPRLLGLALACLLLAPGVGGAESGKGDSRQAPSQAGTRALPNGDFAWVKYQRHVTGQNFEEVWESSQKKMGVDARKEGYVVEAKWTGRNDAARRSSRYNPLHVRYSHDQIEPKLLDQAKRLLELDSHSKGHGVRYAVSNLAAQRHFEQLLRKHFAKATASGQLRVWHVPGDGMK